jgi:cyclic pyranopterin phosphate synthase
MPAEGIEQVEHSSLLPLEKLCEQVVWLVRHTAIERVKLTGGEPLVRKGIGTLIRSLHEIPEIREISLTTNGSLMGEQAWALKEAGLSRINVSLDSLDPDRFALLSRGGRLLQTLEGIKTAIEAGLTPLKLNAVLQLSSWREDVPRLLDYAAELGVEPRFIELMRTGTERAWCDSELVTVDEVQAWLAEQTEVVAIASAPGIPASRSRIRWHGQEMTVGWITPRSHPFCASCERLRMDARGRLRRCLMDPALLDLTALRNLQEDETAAASFSSYMSGKHAPRSMDSEFAMSQIGG